MSSAQGVRGTIHITDLDNPYRMPDHLYQKFGSKDNSKGLKLGYHSKVNSMESIRLLSQNTVGGDNMSALTLSHITMATDNHIDAMISGVYPKGKVFRHPMCTVFAEK